MDQEDLHSGSPDGNPINWPRFFIIAAAVVACFIFLWLLIRCLADRDTRRCQQQTLPRAFLLPVYPRRHSSRVSALVDPAPAYLTYDPHPSPAYEAEDPLNRPATVATPPQIHTRASLQRRVTDEHGEEIIILGSVQPRESDVHPALRRGRPYLEPRASVDTLPVYEEPPPHKSDSGFARSA